MSIYTHVMNEEPSNVDISRHLFQLPVWTKVKSEWLSETITFYQGDNLVGHAQLLVRRLPFGLTYIYIPRGPEMDWTNQELVSYCINTLIQYGRQKKAIAVVFDPNISYNNLTAEVILNKSDHLIWSGPAASLDDTIQPTNQAFIHQDQTLSKKIRQEIRTAKNKGVYTKVYTTDALNHLETFEQLTKATGKRKGISLRNRDYYKRLLEIPDHALTISYLDVAKRKEAIEAELDKLNQKTSHFNADTPDNDVIAAHDKYTRLVNELYDLPDHDLALAGCLTVDNELLYAGSNHNYRHYNGAVVAWQDAITDALTRHAFVNLGGIETAEMTGPLGKWKSKFDAKPFHYLGEFSIVLFPLIFKILKKLGKI